MTNLCYAYLLKYFPRPSKLWMYFILIPNQQVEDLGLFLCLSHKINTLEIAYKEKEMTWWSVVEALSAVTRDHKTEIPVTPGYLDASKIEIAATWAKDVNDKIHLLLFSTALLWIYQPRWNFLKFFLFAESCPSLQFRLIICTNFPASAIPCVNILAYCTNWNDL